MRLKFTDNCGFHYLIERALRKEMRRRWELITELSESDSGSYYPSLTIEVTNMEIDAIADYLLQYQKQIADKNLA